MLKLCIVFTFSFLSSISQTTISIPDYNGYEISCFGANDGWLDVSVTEDVGTPPFGYQLTGPSGYDETNGNGYFNELVAGTYTISIFGDYLDSKILFHQHKSH